LPSGQTFSYETPSNPELVSRQPETLMSKEAEASMQKLSSESLFLMSLAAPSVPLHPPLPVT